MATVTRVKHGREEHVAFRFTPEEAGQLCALAESARKYPGRIRRFELESASICRGDRPVQRLELVADLDAREDAVEATPEVVRFTLCIRGSSAFEEFLHEIVGGAWDLLWPFKKAGNDSKAEITLWIL